MSNIVTWFKPPTLEEAVHLTKRIGAFVKLCQGGYNFNWGPVTQNLEVDPTEFALEHNLTLMDPAHPYLSLLWTVAATAGNTPAYFLPSDPEHLTPLHVVAPIGEPLFTPEQLAWVTANFDIEGWFENYV